jgi:branched-chain amino acid transport system substrate-binding protein
MMASKSGSGPDRRSVLLGIGAAIAAPNVLRAGSPIKLGLLHPMTGAIAYNGEQLRLGSLMAIAEINKAGGIKSMGGATLEPVLGDTQSKVEVGVSEVERMNDLGVAAYLGAYQSAFLIAGTQVAAKYNTPFVIDSGTSDVILNRGLKNVFRFTAGFSRVVDDGIEGLDAINKSSKAPVKTVVIVHESSEYGTGVAKLLEERLAKVGLSLAGKISHDTPTRNFDNIVLRIRSMAPDLVVLINYQNEYELISRTLVQQKIDFAAMYSFLGGGFNYKLVRDQPQVAEYMMDVDHWCIPSDPRAKAMRKEVEGQGRLFTFEIFCAYNAVKLLADALQRAATSEKQPLIDALASSTFSDHFMPYGPTKFVNGQNIGARAAVLQVQKGEIELLRPTEFATAQPVFPRTRI